MAAAVPILRSWLKRLSAAGFVVAAMLVPAAAQGIPGLPVDLTFDAYVATLDLDNPAFEFLYKSGKHQGSSIGFHVALTGHRKSGTFAPTNTSNVLEAEVVSYRLSRFLGISDIYNPITYYRLGPLAALRFKSMLKQHRETDHDRRVNYNSVMAELNAHPKSLLGVYRYRARGSRFVAVSLATEAGHLNTGHPLATFIRANGPQPTDKPMSLAGVKGQRPEFPKPAERESELARQLSNILLVDQLMGQWDRFFNNLEAFGDANGRLQLLARDNGGATVGDWEWHDLYNRWLSRYDRNVIERLKALAAFLHGRDTHFAGFDDVQKWKTAVGFVADDSFNTFSRKLDLLLDKKLPELERQFGARTYFMPHSGAALPKPPAAKAAAVSTRAVP